MKIKESEQLKMLATESGKTANQVSETIVTELINKQIIENISDNWGFPVADCYERDVTVVEMVDVIWYLPGSFRPFGRPVGMCIDWRR